MKSLKKRIWKAVTSREAAELAAKVIDLLVKNIPKGREVQEPVSRPE